MTPAQEGSRTSPQDIPSGAPVTAGVAASARAPATDSPEQVLHLRSFEDARAVARALGFRHRKQWERWAATAQRPADIPAQPRLAYQGRGWSGWADWLGAEVEGRPSAPAPSEAEAESRGAAHAPRRPAGRRFCSFPQARAFARTLGLRRKTDWQAWSASGQRPADIPSEPHVVYRGPGWVSWPDWLGGATAAAARRVTPAPPPAGRGGPAGRPERTTGLGRDVPNQTERGAPAPLAGETGATTAAAPGAARANGGAGARLSQIASGVGYRLRAAAARAWEEVEEIWADAQRLQRSGSR